MLVVISIILKISSDILKRKLCSAQNEFMTMPCTKFSVECESQLLAASNFFTGISINGFTLLLYTELW